MKNIIQNEGTDLIADVDYREGSPGWVTVAYPGSRGVFVDDHEWDAFVELVLMADGQVKLARKGRDK